MRVIFLNRFFYPDHSATSQMLSDLAFALAGNGRHVSIIASRQRYDAPNVQLPRRETINGVEVYRIWTSRFGRHNLVGRAIDYATFYFSAVLMLWRLARRGDMVVSKTDPPMLSVVVAPVLWLRGGKLVNWLQDIFPEVAQALGVGKGRLAGFAYGLIRGLRNRSLRAAVVNVVLGEHMAERLSGLGVEEARIRIIPNWADGSLIAPVGRDQNGLREDWGLSGKFVIGYSGNLGRAHEINTILDAISSLEAGETFGATPAVDNVAGQAVVGGRPDDNGGRADVVWLFIGGGAQFENLKTNVAARGLRSVCFKPYQPREQLAESLSVGDVHLISLRPELEGLIVPSKFYGIAAAGRPTIFIGDHDGEIARIVTRSRIGVVVDQGDFEGLASAVRDLAENPENAKAQGVEARIQFESVYNFPRAVGAWERVIDEVSRTG